jgi:hypothetical protein
LNIPRFQEEKMRKNKKKSIIEGIHKNLLGNFNHLRYGPRIKEREGKEWLGKWL